MKEVLNNNNTVEPKTFHESSDSNRSITCSGKTILCSLHVSNFINKNALATDEDVFKTLDLLPYQTLNENFLAWYDEKDEIVQAQKERKKT